MRLNRREELSGNQCTDAGEVAQGAVVVLQTSGIDSHVELSGMLMIQH